MIHLTLLRHAKARPAEHGQSDHERALAPRGWDDARRVAQALASAGRTPDLILCSDARRCQETWEAVCDVFGGVATRTLEALYLADAETIGRYANAQESNNFMVIAHNPGIHTLASLWSPIGDAGCVRMRQNFATAGAAMFDRNSKVDMWTFKGYFRPKELRPEE